MAVLRKVVLTWKSLSSLHISIDVLVNFFLETVVAQYLDRRRAVISELVEQGQPLGNLGGIGNAVEEKAEGDAVLHSLCSALRVVCRVESVSRDGKAHIENLRGSMG